MKDDTFGRSEHLTGRFSSRSEAETVVRRLTEIGVPESEISVSEKPNVKQRRKLHIGEGLVLGLSVGGLLGALFGAIFAVPTNTLTLMGRNYTGEMAGAISGLGYGLLLGIVLGLVVGVLSRTTASSPMFEFDEQAGDTAYLDVEVPSTLAPRARDILNAS